MNFYRPYAGRRRAVAAYFADGEQLPSERYLDMRRAIKTKRVRAGSQLAHRWSSRASSARARWKMRWR